MSKKPLYFLPGTMCDVTLWRDVWPLLAESFELIHVPIPECESLEQMAESLRSQFAEEKVNLVGFSLGGYLATYFASRYPDCVERMLILANSPCALPESELEQRRKTLDWLKHVAYKGALDSRIRPLLGSSSRSNQELILHIQQMEHSLGLDQLRPQLAATSDREDLAVFLNQTRLPIHFLYGEQDILVNRAWFAQLTNPNISVRNCGDFGHMLPLEAPGVVARQICTIFE